MMLDNNDQAEIEVPHWFELDTEIKQFCTSMAAQGDKDLRDGAERKKYVVMLTAGDEDGGTRATLAFSAACTAISMDFDTRVFLIGDGSHWAYESACATRAQPGFPPLTELVDAFLHLGGKIYLCAACDQASKAWGRDPGGKRRNPKVQSLGLAPVLTHMVGSTTLTL